MNFDKENLIPKSELVIGEVYYTVSNDGSMKCIGRYYESQSPAYIVLKQGRFEYEKTDRGCFNENFNKFIPADALQITHLVKCEKACKYLEPDKEEQLVDNFPLY